MSKAEAFFDHEYGFSTDTATYTLSGHLGATDQAIRADIEETVAAYNHFATLEAEIERLQDRERELEAALRPIIEGDLGALPKAVLDRAAAALSAVSEETTAYVSALPAEVERLQARKRPAWRLEVGDGVVARVADGVLRVSRDALESNN